MRGGVLVDEVLGTSLDALALDARDHFIRHFSRQERISPRPISQNPLLVTPPTHENGSKLDSPLQLRPAAGARIRFLVNHRPSIHGHDMASSSALTS